MPVAATRATATLLRGKWCYRAYRCPLAIASSSIHAAVIIQPSLPSLSSTLFRSQSTFQRITATLGRLGVPLTGAVVGGALPPVPPEKRPKNISLHGIQWQDEYAWLANNNNSSSNGAGSNGSGGGSSSDDGRMIKAHLERENEYALAFMAPAKALQMEFASEHLAHEARESQSVPAVLGGYAYYARTTCEGESIEYRRRLATTTKTKKISSTVATTTATSSNNLEEIDSFLNGTVVVSSDDKTEHGEADSETTGSYHNAYEAYPNTESAAALEDEEEIVLDRAWLRRELGLLASAPLGLGPLKPSPSAKAVAFTVDPMGSDRPTLLVLGQEPGSMPAAFRRITDRIHDAINFEWSSCGKYIIYTRPDAINRPASLHVRALKLPETADTCAADDVACDRLILEETDDRYFMDVGKTKDESYITVNLNSKLDSEVRVLPSHAVGNGHETRDMALLCARGHLSYFVEHAGDRFFIVTTSSTGGSFRIMSTPEAHPHVDHWQDVDLGSDAYPFITDAEVFANHLVTYHRDDEGLPLLRCMPYDSPGAARNIRPWAAFDPKSSPNPETDGGTSYPMTTATKSSTDGSLGSSSVYTLEPQPNLDFGASHIYFGTTDPLNPYTDWAYDMTLDRLKELRRQETADSHLFDWRDFVCRRERTQGNTSLARSSKGSSSRIAGSGEGGGGVPMTLVHSSSAPTDGSAPALLLVYGAYGEPLEPRYHASRLALLRRGWTLIYCHVRGGGDLGAEWHQAAVGVDKSRTFLDLLACARHVLDAGLAAPGRLCVRGVSAGGLAAAVLCNRHPELLSAAVLRVPFVDVLTAMMDESLPLTTHERDEWGDPCADESVFAAMREYCPYHNVGAQDYPAMLLRGSLHDDRVQYWHPAKMAARLRDRGTGCRPILLRTDMDGGHFGGSSVDEEAFDCAFLQQAVDGVF